MQVDREEMKKQKKRRKEGGKEGRKKGREGGWKEGGKEGNRRQAPCRFLHRLFQEIYIFMDKLLVRR